VRFLLMIGGEEGATERDGLEICNSPEARACNDDLASRHAVPLGALLRPASEAVTVRVRDGKVVVSDGPFAETKEQMGGIALIDCADRAEAITIAAAHPSAGFGMVEVRPIWEQ